MAGESVRRMTAGGVDTSVIDNWRHSERLTTVWDRGVKSPVIAMLYGLVVFNTDNRKMYRHMAEVARVAPGASVLDIPSGGGVVLRALRPRHKVRYVAADISPLMLAKVRDEAHRRGLDFVETREADAGALPFEDGSFDMVVSYSGLHCVPDPQLALKEMARVLRPGGRLRGSVVVRGVNRVTDTFINVWVRRRILDVVDTERALLTWLTDAGFDRLITHRSGAVVYFDGIKSA